MEFSKSSDLTQGEDSIGFMPSAENIITYEEYRPIELDQPGRHNIIEIEEQD
jgi:hypothetical protein